MWLFLMVNVGTYTSPMDGMGFLGGLQDFVWELQDLGGECVPNNLAMKNLRWFLG